MGGGDMEIVVEEMSVCYRQGTSLERQALSDLTLKIPAGTFAGGGGGDGVGQIHLDPGARGTAPANPGQGSHRRRADHP